MSRCPVCQTVRIVIVISPERRAFCTRCGARWIQEGGVQRAVRRPTMALAPSSTHEPEPKQA